jgi:hypothetical protein
MMKTRFVAVVMLPLLLAVVPVSAQTLPPDQATENAQTQEQLNSQVQQTQMNNQQTQQSVQQSQLPQQQPFNSMPQPGNQQNQNPPVAPTSP